jgi:gliding motility-associated-like protein
MLRFLFFLCSVGWGSHFLAAQSTPTPTIWLDATPPTVEPNDTFSVDIHVSDVTQWATFQATLGWQPAQIELISVEKLLTAQMGYQIALGNGACIISYATPSGSGNLLTTGDTVVARVHFRAIVAMGLPIVSPLQCTEFAEIGYYPTGSNVPVAYPDPTLLAGQVLIQDCPDTWPGLPTDTTICAGSSLLIVPCTGCNFLLEGTPVPPTGTAIMQAGQYQIIASNATFCTADATFEVAFFENLAWALPTQLMLCSGDSATISPSPLAAVATFEWSDGSTEPTLTTISTGTYGLTVTDANGCTSTAYSTVVEYNTPDLSILPDSTSVCAGNAIFFENAPPEWVFAWAGGSAVPLASGWQGITVTNQFGCSTPGNVYATLQTIEGFDPLPTDFFCSQQLGTIGYPNPPVGHTYAWSSGDTLATLLVTAPMSATYVLTITSDLSGCKLQRSFDVEVIDFQVVELTDSLICTDEPLTIGLLNPVGQYTYTWAHGAATPLTDVLGVGQYVVTVSDPITGCQHIDSVQVALRTLLGGAPDDTHVLRYDSVELVATGGVSYRWQMRAPDSLLSDSARVVVQPPIDTRYFVHIIDAFGCAHHDSVLVIVDAPPTINAFSPNGDGVNDRLVFDELLAADGSIRPGVVLRIWDAWGTEIFESTHYRNDWDGTLNGREVPHDTYFFTLIFPNNQQKRGTITVLR